MSEYDVDAHAYDEVRYEEHRQRFSSGLCVLCKNDAAVEYDDLCEACIEECIGEVKLEELAA